MLQVGDQAPLDIFVEDQDGSAVSLQDYLGKFVVVYFYPKDDTPGCTKEACEFRDGMGSFEKLDVPVIGVSKDSPSQHQKFIAKYDLSFQLWSDPDHELQDAFGVWQKKKFMGKEFMGTVRSTFIVDPEGMVVKVWEKVTPAGHADEVEKALKKLK